MLINLLLYGQDGIRSTGDRVMDMDLVPDIRNSVTIDRGHHFLEVCQLEPYDRHRKSCPSRSASARVYTIEDFLVAFAFDMLTRIKPKNGLSLILEAGTCDWLVTSEPNVAL